MSAHGPHGWTGASCDTGTYRTGRRLETCEIREGLRWVGVSAGDWLVVHSSLHALGPTAGGPVAVVEAILEVIEERGNLLTPTFNYAPMAPFFDPDLTVGRTGALAEAVRAMPGAKRSDHPTHSVAVIGPDAGRLTEGHRLVRAVGIDSPIDRLAQAGGWVLLMGVDHTANTTIHVGEEYAHVPKAMGSGAAKTARVRLRSGQIVEHTLDDSPTCSLAFNAVEHGLRRHGEIVDGVIGECHLQLMRGLDVVRRTVDLLRESPEVLLCTRGDCVTCQERRRLYGAKGGG